MAGTGLCGENYTGERMLRKCVWVLAIVFVVISFNQDANAQGVISKSEISVSVMGDYQQYSSGNNIGQSATNGGGFLLGYRYHFSRLIAAELDYGRTRVSEVYDGGGLGRVQSDVHEVTGSLVLTSPIGLFGLKPYVLAGAGGLLFDPTHNPTDFVPGASTQFEPAPLFGVGLDYSLLPHVAIRLDYRGIVMKAPDFGLKSLNTGGWTQINQPAAGIVIRF